jgi:hypothetical protein
VDSFKPILLDLVKTAKRDGVGVLLVKEPFNGGRGDLNCKAYYKAMEEVGRETGAPVAAPLDRFHERFDSLAPLFMDAVHLTRKGNTAMAWALVGDLESTGLLDR